MPTNRKKSKRKNQREILALLRNRIIDGMYPPGSKLVEKDLVKEYVVSRSMLREVLVKLEIQGLVHKQPNKGVVVRKIDAKSLLETMEIREALEGLAARLATEKTSAKDWVDLEEEFGQPCDEFIRNLNFDKYLELTRKFRRRMFAAAENKELSDLSDTLFAKILLVQRRLTILPGRINQSAEEQRAVLKAIIEGDPIEAERLKRLNLRNAKDCLYKYKDWIF